MAFCDRCGQKLDWKDYKKVRKIPSCPQICGPLNSGDRWAGGDLRPSACLRAHNRAARPIDCGMGRGGRGQEPCQNRGDTHRTPGGPRGPCPAGGGGISGVCDAELPAGEEGGCRREGQLEQALDRAPARPSEQIGAAQRGPGPVRAGEFPFARRRIPGDDRHFFHLLRRRGGQPGRGRGADGGHHSGGGADLPAVQGAVRHRAEGDAVLVYAGAAALPPPAGGAGGGALGAGPHPVRPGAGGGGGRARGAAAVAVRPCDGGGTDPSGRRRGGAGPPAGRLWTGTGPSSRPSCWGGPPTRSCCPSS